MQHAYIHNNEELAPSVDAALCRTAQKGGHRQLASLRDPHHSTSGVALISCCTPSRNTMTAPPSRRLPLLQRENRFKDYAVYLRGHATWRTRRAIAYAAGPLAARREAVRGTKSGHIIGARVDSYATSNPSACAYLLQASVRGESHDASTPAVETSGAMPSASFAEHLRFPSPHRVSLLRRLASAGSPQGRARQVSQITNAGSISPQLSRTSVRRAPKPHHWCASSQPKRLCHRHAASTRRPLHHTMRTYRGR